MKKISILLLILVALFMLSSCLTTARVGGKHQYFDSNKALSVAFDTIFSNTCSSGYGCNTYGQNYYNSGYGQYHRAAQQRIRQHERAIQRYEECLVQRRVDIYQFNVHPQNARDCSRYHPANKRWR